MKIRLDKRVTPLELRILGIDRQMPRLTLWVLRLVFYFIIVQALLLAVVNLIAGWYAFAFGQLIGVVVIWSVLHSIIRYASSKPGEIAAKNQTTTESDTDDGPERKPTSKEVVCENCQSIVNHREIDCPECGANTRTGA